MGICELRNHMPFLGGGVYICFPGENWGFQGLFERNRIRINALKCVRA